jgi:nucleotide-binding universal stress UspA family protein
MERIVVGVDGSAAARRALRWAADEAAKRGAVLDVVHAYRLPYTPETERSTYALASRGGLSSVNLEELQRRREEDLRNAQNQALGRIDLALGRVGVDTTKVKVERHAVAGTDPEHALIDLSRNAVMVVVGSRGRGAVVGRLLGSVSRACVEHAHCPVVVLPPLTEKEAAEA